MNHFQQRQQMANQNNPQAATAQQQQRLMRPVMANNPGLRHLLQQVHIHFDFSKFTFFYTLTALFAATPVQATTY